MRKLIIFVMFLSLNQAYSSSLFTLEDLMEQTKSDDITRDTYIGEVQFPPVKTLPSLRIYYKGTKIDMYKKSYLLTEEKDTYGFYMLVSEHVQPKVRLGRIEYLSIVADTPYKLYKIVRTANSWSIEEIKLKDKIPDNTIIVLYNPEYVDHLENTQAHVNNTYKLPIIVMKDISEDLLHQASTNALLASLDLDTYHSKENSIAKEIKQNQKSVIISMGTKS